METILIIDNYDSFTYNLVHYVEENPNFKVDVFRNDKININTIKNYDTIILSPGPGLPKDAGILKAIIQKYASSKKILGVCLGMQAIGEVFGGQLSNLKQVYHGVATPITITNEQDPIFKNLPKTINVGRYHSWIVSHDNFPEELEVTSVEENGQIMSLKHEEYKVFGVQFHPESILTEHGKKMINNFLSI
jgi:anthranilate synthase component 2